MDHMQEWKSACRSPAFPSHDQRPTTIATSFYGTRKGSGGATLSFILFCLILLLAAPGQAKTDDRLAPQDTVEVRVSGWHTLRGGVAEGVMLSGAFTIGMEGMLDLPIIGLVPAAGLRANELAN
jgi:protein involved in polysaccharide export with SLBB domain